MIMDNDKNIIALREFIKNNSSIWDLTDVEEFLLYHKDEIIELLQKIDKIYK
jgi:hypothetical protein